MLGGRVGDDLKANEVMLKATKDEWVLTGQQYDNLTSNLTKLMGAVKQPQASNQEVRVVIDMHDFSITKDSLPNFEKLLKDRVPKIINDSLFSKGIKK